MGFNFDKPRLDEKKDFMSRDLVALVRYFCFSNISEFYRRYSEELGVSRATFFRMIQGGAVAREKVAKVSEVCSRLGLLENEDECDWVAKKKLTIELVKRTKILCENPSINNLGNLKEHVDKHAFKLLS